MRAKTPPHRAFLLALAACALGAATAAARETPLSDILSGLERVQKLKMMPNDEGDTQLRRRTPEQILASGRSTGCGDYAFSFYHLMAEKGLEVRYVDAAALNYASVLNHFDGHTAVAIKDPLSGNWILVDPTFDRIVSADWDDKQRLYAGPAGRFWIGYVGTLEKYPVHDPEGLKRFYAETLATVPREVWKDELLGFEFIVDPSMVKKDGGYTNAHLPEFLRRPGDVAKSLGVSPSRTVKVVLTDSGGPGGDDCSQDAAGAWTCRVSRDAAMSAGMTDWMARRIQRATAP